MSYGGESFGQKLPPLYKVIQSILQDYPCGQIFKEVIQNADDARATEVKFFLDYRDIDTLPKSLVNSKCHPELHKYQGQALVAFNNAPFTERDWDGVQSLQDSNKAADPHRVGKFGLGFNSVYHITDLPVILSEEYCAFLEPHQVIWEGKPGQRYTLNNLQKIEPNFVNNFSPFGDYHADKFHNQTIFRFPLRKYPSKMSSELFSMKRLEQLVDVLKNEARYLLLFLRSVQSIEVIRIQNSWLLWGSVSCQQIFKVSMNEKDRINLQENFFTKMSSILPKQVISHSACVTIQIEPANSHHVWALVHRVGSEDDEVLKLAESQCVLPWVSTACELTDLEERGGHLFCSLPLPTEERAPFKVNVNGTFAVCSNRRSLKWEEEERQNDEEGTWNKGLVEKCLPHCYLKLMHFLMTTCKISPSKVYNYYPSVKLIENTPWQYLLEPFYTQLFTSSSVLYTTAYSGKWIGVNEAIMLMKDDKRPQAIEKALLQMNIPVLKPPDVILEAKKYALFNFNQVTPSFMRDKSRNFLSYITLKLTHSEKLSILEYCLRDEKYSDLDGLDLLPLADKTFISFSTSLSGIPKIFLTIDKIPHTLLPNLNNRFVDPFNFSLTLSNALVKLAKSKETQLLEISVPIIAKLLVTSQVHLWPMEQLERLWTWLLQQGHSLKYFEGTRIIPVKGKGEHKVLAKNEIIFVPNTSHCSSRMASVLSKYQLIVIKQRDFPFLRHDELSEYLRHLNPYDVLSAIEDYYFQAVELTNDEALEFQNFLSHDYDIVSEKINIISNICMFQTIQGSLCSIEMAKTNHTFNAIVEQESYNLGELAPASPLVISYNKNNQTLIDQLINKTPLITYKSKISFFKEFIFPAINSRTYSDSNIDKIMKIALDLLAQCIEQYDYMFALKQVRFLSVNTYQRRCCIPELYDPSDSLLLVLFKGQHVFPLKPFNSYDILATLKKCGLKTRDSVTGADVSNIIKSLIENQYHDSPEIVHERACAVIKFMNECSTFIFSRKISKKHTLQSFIMSVVERSAWIPVYDTPPLQLSRRTDGELNWKGSSYNNNLAPITDVVVLDESISESILPWIMGSSVCFMKLSATPSDQLRTLFSQSKVILVDKVIEHFQHVINKQFFLSNDTVSYISSLTYEYLSQAHKELDIFYIQMDEWLWIEKESCFVCPKATAFNSHPSFNHDLSPFIHILPSQYRKFEDLLYSYGTTFAITDNQIISVLDQLQGSLISYDKKVTMAISILEWIIMEEIDVSDVLVPIQSDEFEMLPVSQVVYPISDALRCFTPSVNEITYNLVHSQITKKLAKKLGINTLESHLGIAQDIVTEDVGQHEPLIDRLQDILKQYQDTDGYTVVKEMLQNADDAGATEINVLFDFRQHTKSGLYYKEMEEAHGPALIIHNNKQFTEEDFINITRLGASQKGKQGVIKIGKFGVGFCSVYHITDIPSFISSNQLYIFDPTLTYLKEHVRDKSQPGQKANFTSPLLRNQTSPFHNLFGFKSNEVFDGTIFRLPFRTSPSELSKNCYDPLTYSQLLFERLKSDGSKLMLFLNNVTKITVSEISSSSTVPQTKLIIQKLNENMQLPPNITFINIVNNDSQESWLICSEHQIINDKNHSTGSVACKLNCTQNGSWEVEKLDGEMFCFLPLGLIKTGLPVYVSANFAVTTNRRGIWISDSKEPTEKEVTWNHQLIDGPVTKAYYLLLKMLQSLSSNNSVVNYSFHSLWPLQSQLMSKNPWSQLVINLYQLFATQHSCGLLKTAGSGTWLTMRQCKILQDPILVSGGCSTTPSCVYEILSMIKDERIVVLPCEYTNELRGMYTVRFFKEMDFIVLLLKKFIQNLENNLELRNRILLCIYETFSLHIDQNEISDSTESQFQVILMSNPCLPCGHKGRKLRLCHEAVDSSSPLAILFKIDDNRFPCDSFIKSPPCRRAMVHLGLIQKKLPHDLLIETIKRIPSKYTTEPNVALCQVNVVIDCLNLLKKLPTNSSIPKLQFLPVLKKPKNYFLPWKGEKYDRVLVSSDEVMHGKNLPNLVGSQECILDYTLLPKFTEETAKLLGISCYPNTDVVLNQLTQLIKYCQDYNMTNERKKFVHLMYKDIVDFLEKVQDIECHPFMLALQLRKSEEEPEVTLPPKIASIKCIWTGNEFVLPSSVAKQWKTNGPLLYPVPPVLSDKLHLIKAFSCQDKFEIPKLLSSLTSLYEMYSNKPVPEHCRDVLLEIISELNNTEDEEFEKISEVQYLPDTLFRMQRISDLVYKDVDWCDDDNDDSIFYVNSIVTSSLTKNMKVLSTREKSLSLHSHDNFVKFGQNERLTVRINNIIRDYPFDVTFIKELIQNADDAGASKVVFIVDKRNHGTEKVFSDNWKELQGPALLVWNDSVFSEDDLKGIQQLGFGGKRQAASSAETIGRFGIGFNVVYNITDCPSFVTHSLDGQTLCILDPQCKYVPKATSDRPGGRYNNIDIKGSIWEKFSDVASTFSFKGCSKAQLAKSVTKSGTLFRLPFRTETCFKTSTLLHPELDDKDLTEIEVDLTDNVIITDDLFIDKLKDWIDDIKMMLLFLTNVKCLEIYTVESTSNEMKCLFSCKNTLHNEGKRIEYREACRNFEEPVLVHYTLENEMGEFFTERKKKCNEIWFIQQGIGNMNNPNENWRFVPSLKPRHGIAARLSPPIKEHFEGKLFCFLPLPECTHLPVHLNGQFILTSARRDVWKPTTPGGSDDNSKWNEAILDALSSSYAILLQTLTKSFPGGLFSSQEYKDIKKLCGDVKNYFWLFPTQRKLKIDEEHSSVVPSGDWEQFAQSVFIKLFECNARILPSVSHIPDATFTQSKLMIKWSILFDKENDILSPNQSYFYFKNKPKNNSEIEKALKVIGMNINLAPIQVWKAFKGVEHILPTVDETSVYEFCRQYCSHGLPCPLEETKFKNHNTFITILKYILSEDIFDKEFPVITIVPYVASTWPYNPPFLLTADNQLRVIDKTTPVICSTFFSLFPQSLWNHFLHHDLVHLYMNSSYFYNHSEHGDSLLMTVISETLPKCLKHEMVERIYLPQNSIYNYLKCFHSDVFKPITGKILSQWALIPSQNYLFVKKYDNREHCLLPIVNLSADESQSHSEAAKEIESTAMNLNDVFEALNIIGMPALDITVFQYLIEDNETANITTVTNTDLIKELECPDISDPSKILHNLLLCYEKGLVQSFEEIPDIIFQYLGQINFKTDSNKLAICSLPLFETIHGRFEKLADQKAYIWPSEFPRAGLPICNSAIFLNGSGNWRKLGGIEALEIEKGEPVMLYLNYIFQQMNCMSDDDIKEHLIFIKEELIDMCIVTNSNSCMSFIQQLSNLKIIRNEEGVLCSPNTFADHRENIFRIFNGIFQLLPQKGCYRNDEWMDFLLKIGLQAKLNMEMFISMCRDVESLDTKKFENIEKASNSLLTYLLKSFRAQPDKAPWPKSDIHRILCRIADIKFVTLKLLPCLDDIASQYTNNCIRVNDTCLLTALGNSAVVECAHLVWTVKPIINIPEKYKKDDEIASALNKYANVTINRKLLIEDCFSNLKNIAGISKYCDSALFNHYPHPPPSQLLQVIVEHLQCLASASSFLSLSDIKSLSVMKCIPVTVDLLHVHSDKLVLVQPETVIINNQEADNLKPFLHCLHRFILSKVPMPFLEEIGILATISINHCHKVLCDMHSLCKTQPVDFNTKEKLDIILCHLLSQLKTVSCVNIENPLYLPDIIDRLMPSTDLLYVDDKRFDEVSNFQVSCQSTVSIFRAHSNDFEKELCRLLPMINRPLPLSLSCNWSLASHSVVVDHTEFTTVLQQTVRQHLLIPTLEGILLKYFPSEDTTSINFKIVNAIKEYFQSIIFGAEVVAVSNLHINLHNDDRYLCSSPVKYFINENTHHSTCIYVDSSVGSFDSKFAVCLPMSLSIIRAALWKGRLDCEMKETLELVMPLQSLLEAHNEEHFRAISQHFAFALDTSQINSSQTFTPHLGEQVPSGLHNRLDRNKQDAVFRYLEWVAYEHQPDSYIFAKIQHPVYNYMGEIAQPLMFSIMTSYEGDVKEVEINKLYKFLPFVPEDEDQPDPYNIDEPEYHPSQSEGNRWLRQSEVDYKACQFMHKEMLNSNGDLAGHVCFLSQQLAEKVLKGVMYVLLGVTDLRNHQLNPLVSKLRSVNPKQIPSECIVKARQLEHYYIPTRYPNACSSSRIPAECYSVEDAKRAFDNATDIYETLKKQFYRPM